MTLPELSIKRPVLATVFSIVLVLFGIIGFVSTGVRDYPSVDPPIITVTTNYVGANSDVMISQITEPLEESINGIDGIKNITSTSSDGRSSIRVEFGLDIDLEAAANDVRDRVSRAQRNLPPQRRSAHGCKIGCRRYHHPFPHGTKSGAVAFGTLRNWKQRF